MMASVLLSRVIGLLREMVIAYVGGAGGAVDVYQIAFVIPEILNHVVASGFLSVTFIPIFSGYLADGNEAEGWHVFSTILTLFGGLLAALIGVALLFAPTLIDLFAPGLDDPALKAAAVRMTRIILPAQFFFFAGGLFMAVQFAKERFAVPALAPLIYNVGIIAGGLLLGKRVGMEGFSWGVVAGAFVGNFAVQWYGARRVGMRFRPRFDIRHPDIRKYVRLTLPLMVGLTMTFSTEIFLRFFGSFLPRGGIAALNYGIRIMFILVGFFGQAVGVASFPFMARLAAEGKIAEMNDLLNRTLRYLALVMPFSALFMVLRHEIVLILFQRGRFDAAATALTARVLLFLMAGTVAFAAQTVVVRGYYATQDTLFPALFGTLSVLLSLPLYWFGMERLGVDGVALAITLSAVFQVGLLYLLWNRRTGNPESAGVWGFFLKIAVIACGIGGLLEGLRRLSLGLVDTSDFWGALIVCGVVGTAFVMLLVGAGYLFRVPEISVVLGRMVRRSRPRR